MKTINLYLKFHFTSLSPDAQPISLGIVGDSVKPFECMVGFEDEIRSFYAEFADFDINRCDNWVRDNVISNLNLSGYKHFANRFNNNWKCRETFEGMKFYLNEWLEQFKDYNIQFVVDCGWLNWYWMVQLLGEWDKKEYGRANMFGDFKECMIGLPVLPENVSPISEDLNDLIARVKGISVREAFDLNREKLMYSLISGRDDLSDADYSIVRNNIGNITLWDIEVIKTIYNKIK